jgi:hypothetical protein
MTRIKCIALHPVALPSGAVLHPGRVADINLKHPVAQLALENGQIVAVADAKPAKSRRRKSAESDTAPDAEVSSDQSPEEINK